MIRSGRQFAEANHEIIVVRLGRGLLQLMHLQIVKLPQRGVYVHGDTEN